MSATGLGASLPAAPSIAVTRAGPESAWSRFLREPTTRLGLAMLAIVAVVTVVGPLVYTASPYRTNVDALMQGPSARFPLGTDQLGRDVLARLLNAGLVSIPMGMLAIGLGGVVGSAVGLVSGYAGGWLDLIVMRVVDVMLSFPGLLIALVVVAILGPSGATAVVAVSLSAMPSYARVVRSTVLALRGAGFIEAARIADSSPLDIVVRHVLRNVGDVILVLLVIGMGNGMIVLAALSFLGIGVQPPQADWGVMLTDGVRAIYLAPLAALAPAAMMMLTVLGINLTGEGLQVLVNPAARAASQRARL